MEPKTRADRLAAWTIRAPGRALGVVLGIHALVWMAGRAVLYPNLPLAVIVALLSGRYWQFGN